MLVGCISTRSMAMEEPSIFHTFRCIVPAEDRKRREGLRTAELLSQLNLGRGFLKQHTVMHSETCMQQVDLFSNMQSSEAGFVLDNGRPT